MKTFRMEMSCFFLLSSLRFPLEIIFISNFNKIYRRKNRSGNNNKQQR